MSRQYPKFRFQNRTLLIRDYTGTHYFFGIRAWLKYRKQRVE